MHGGSGCFAAGLEHGVDAGNVLFKLFAAIADGLKFFLKDVGQEALHLHIAQTATGIVRFEFVEVGIVGQVALEVLFLAEGVEIGKYAVALQVTGV